MSKQTKTKIKTAIPGVILIVAVAAGLTVGAQRAVAELTKPKPVAVKKVVAVKKEEPKAVEPTPAPVAPAPAVKTATTKGFVHFRAARSTSSKILADLEANTTVTLGSYSDTLWQQATYNGQTGYIYKRYLIYN